MEKQACQITGNSMWHGSNFFYMSHNSLIKFCGHPELRMRIHFVTSGCGVLQFVYMGGFMPDLGSVSGDQALPEEEATVRSCPAKEGDSVFLY